MQKKYGTNKERKAFFSFFNEVIYAYECLLKEIKTDGKLKEKVRKNVLCKSKDPSDALSMTTSILREYQKFCPILWQVIDTEQSESIHIKLKKTYSYNDEQYISFIRGFFQISAELGQLWTKEIYRDFFYEEIEKTKKMGAAYIALLYEGLHDLYAIGYGPTRTSINFYQIQNFPSPEDTYSNVINHVAARAMKDMPILIVGETGTSKELTARAMHTISRRRNKPFVEINCAAIPSSLLESELFGIAKGAATNVLPSEGRIKEADGGIFFLDELGKMDTWLQAKLLKAVEENKIRKVGGKNDEDIDVRFIAAAQPDDLNNFLPDLKYRLGYPNVVRMPTLNERIADLGTEIILKCFERVLKKLSINIEEIVIDYDVLFVMMMHRYKGNYRELENILASLILSAQINLRNKIISLDLVEIKEIFQISSDPTYIAKCILSLMQHLDNSRISEEANEKLDKYKKIFRSCSIEIIASAIGENRNIGIELPVKRPNAIKDSIFKLIKSLSVGLLSMVIKHADKSNMNPDLRNRAIKLLDENPPSEFDESSTQNHSNENQNRWHDYKDYLLNDFIDKVPLKGIVSEADNVRSMLIEKKVIDCLKLGKEMKSLLVSEGLPERNYQNYLKKIKNITGKGINEFKQMI